MPLYIIGMMQTLSPTLISPTSSPTSSTVPLNSCLIVMGTFSLVIGCGFFGMRFGPPSYSWRSCHLLTTFHALVRLIFTNMFHKCQRVRVWPVRCQFRLGELTDLVHPLTFTWPFPHTGIGTSSSRRSFWPWYLTARMVPDLLVAKALAVRWIAEAMLGNQRQYTSKNGKLWMKQQFKWSWSCS